jgi:hypothetical protein
METTQLHRKMDSRLELLLDRFEKEVEPYERISSLFLLLSPIGVMLSVLVPLPIISYTFHVNPFSALVSGGMVCWTIGAILSVLGSTKLAILFLDHTKHKISKTKYKPLTGVCMCDLSQLRSHLLRMEKAKTVGERLRHSQLADYYQQQIGWKSG